MFSRLKRWLERLIPFEFQVEHKPGAKNGLADYLSRSPNGDRISVRSFDSMFTVVKINKKRHVLRYDQSNFITEPVITSSKAKPSIKITKKQIFGHEPAARGRCIMQLQISQ